MIIFQGEMCLATIHTMFIIDLVIMKIIITMETKEIVQEHLVQDTIVTPQFMTRIILLTDIINLKESTFLINQISLNILAVLVRSPVIPM